LRLKLLAKDAKKSENPSNLPAGKAGPFYQCSIFSLLPQIVSFLPRIGRKTLPFGLQYIRKKFFFCSKKYFNLRLDNEHKKVCKNKQGGVMKSYIFMIGISIILMLSLLDCSDKQQSPVSPGDQVSLEKITITNFTLTHFPEGMTGEGTIKLVGGNWILKDVGVIEILNSSDPLAAGTMTHYLSCNYDAVTGEGPVHGYWTLVPQANTNGGVWEGNYTGYRSKMPGSDILFVLPLKLVGHGRGGTIDGMQLFSNTTIIGWGIPPEGWYGSAEGFYKSH
jgi:hypothetical protein